MKKRVLIAQYPFQVYSFGKRVIERIKPPQMITNAVTIIIIADVLIYSSTLNSGSFFHGKRERINATITKKIAIPQPKVSTNQFG